MTRTEYHAYHGFARACKRSTDRITKLVNQGFRAPFRDCELHALSARARFAYDRLPAVVQKALQRPEAM